MLEKFKYINHQGEVLEFGKAPLFVNENDLHDFSWEVNTVNNRISGFGRGIVEKTIPIILKCKSKVEGLQMRNRIFEVCEKDVLANKHGRIYVGDYYLKCFVTDCTKSGYLLSNEYMELEIGVQSDFPHWTKESVFYFGAESSNTSGIDFKYDFPYDLPNNFFAKEIFNSDFVPSNFRIDIYGAAINPAIHIGNHEYKVNVEVEKGEYLTIDSTTKTIILTKNDGTKINCFKFRGRESYIFEKIKSGNNFISSSAGEFRYVITLLEDRSEPKWI